MTSPGPPADDRAAWSLSGEITYLNHGSFGPSPRAVQAARSQWLARLEADPVDFLKRQAPAALAAVRARLAAWIGARADDLVLVDNATTAMNLVARSFPLGPADQVLLGDHEYGAVVRLWQRRCAAAGAEAVIVPIRPPFATDDDLLAPLVERFTERTRLVVVSHVSSPTALVFPVEALCRAARGRGIAVCIDGPHALAMLELDLARLDCDYYAASCHKWLSAPFGTGFLWVHPRRQAAIEPLVSSWGGATGRPPGQPPGWQDEFNWLGTRDPTGLLAIDAAIDFLEARGLARFRSQTQALARDAALRLGEAVAARPLVPLEAGLYGSMIALELEPGPVEPLEAALWREHRIEIPIVAWQGRRLARVSCHLYNDRGDIDRLAAALGRCLSRHG